MAGAALVLGALAASDADAKTVTVGQLFTPEASCVANTTFLQTAVSSGMSYIVSSSGLITSWSFEDGLLPVAGLKLKVGRPASGGKYTIVAQSTAGVQKPMAVNTYSTKIKVKKGDILGIYEDGGVCKSTLGKTSPDVDRYNRDDVPPGSTRVYGRTHARIPVSADVLLAPFTFFTSATFPPHGANFGFKAPGATSYQCRLIGPQQSHPSFTPCSSPKSYSNLPSGSYTFQARGVNEAGPDPHPATAKFTE